MSHHTQMMTAVVTTTTTATTPTKFSLVSYLTRGFNCPRVKRAVWTAEDESAYVETLLTRVPDALTQRFLTHRTVAASIGIDANERNVGALRAARDVLKALLLLAANEAAKA